MSDFKRKASSEIDASEEPNAKRHQSSQGQTTMTQAQVINSADAWNSTEEATDDDASPTQGVPAQDVPAQVTPAQHLEVQGMPSQDAPAQVAAAPYTEKRGSKPKGKSVEPNTEKSARRLRLESMEDPGQDVRERGTVRNVDGDLCWVASEGTLVPCVYHNSIRAELIAEASHNGTFSYDVPRQHGNLEFNTTDVTAYHPEQQTWSEQRSLWPRIRDNILNRLERKDYKERHAGQSPAKMMHNGRLVVDHDNHPVYMFPDLPATLSSAIEGWWLEAVTRLDSRIDRMDIRARLPAFRGKTGMKKQSKLYGLSAIGNKRLRFREREGLIAWDSRVGSDLINQFYKSRLPAGCVDRNTTEGGGPLNPAEKKHVEGFNSGKPEHADKAKGRKNGSNKSLNAAGRLSAQDLGHDGPTPEIQVYAATSIPTPGQQSRTGPPNFGAPGAHTPGFAPQINLDRPSNGGDSADISIPRGLTPAQVLDQYRFLSNLTGTTEDDFEAAIEAIRDEEEAYASIRPGHSNRGQQNGRGTEETNEFSTSAQCSNMQPMNLANEHAEDALTQPHDMQRLDDATGTSKYIIDLTTPSPSMEQSTSAAAASEAQQPPQQQSLFHNTIGDEDWAPEEEIDEEFWEETMHKDWHSAGVQGNNQPNVEDAEPGLNEGGEDTAPLDVQAALFNSYGQASQLAAPQPSAGEQRSSPDPLFGSEDGSVPALELEPIQPGSGQVHLPPNPEYDPFAPADDELVPTQQALQVDVPQTSDGENYVSSDPLFEDLFADWVPELTLEGIQDIGTSLEPSDDFANYPSPLLDQRDPEGPLAPSETATTGSKRKMMDDESSNGSKKVQLQGNLTAYTPYQPRQDKPRVPMQRTEPRQPLPAYVSSAPAPLLGQGSLPTPTATPEKPSTLHSATSMPPPRHQPLPANQSSLPHPALKNAKPHGARSNSAKTPLAQPTPYNPQRHQALPPYQSQLPPFTPTHNVPPTPTPTPPNAAPIASPQAAPSQPNASAAATDHRYTAPTTPEQMALIITLLEPTIAQFRDLMQGTPYADYVVDTDMAASYMHQYQHIVRELRVLWVRMNWDRSGLPRLSVVRGIDAAMWEGR